MPKLRPVVAAPRSAAAKRLEAEEASNAMSGEPDAGVTRRVERLEVGDGEKKGVAAQLGDIVAEQGAARRHHGPKAGQRPTGPRPNDPDFVDDDDVPPLM